MSRILLVLMLAIFSVVAIAGEISAEDKAKVQLTLVKWIKSRSDDKGRFLFVDRQTNDLMGGYSANVHPMILPYKDGAVFVCREHHVSELRRTSSLSKSVMPTRSLKSL
ncbi:MAG TPA: hypothetical protein EYO66_01055 [Gammaproteobacteria bacterium]|nr:hypothetical protein [Gammaproteobacteria bacterium]